eukprot:m.145174 g.145174  ORF g.145174 m.145174 type:complete len:217 (-) comp30423_c0_seq3:149-799(-)
MELDDSNEMMIRNQPSVFATSWQGVLLYYLEHTYTKISLVLLLVFDLLLVIIGSAIEIQVLDAKLADLEVQCIEAKGRFGEEEFELAGDPSLELAHQLSELLSLYILFLFLMESILQFVARGRSYFKEKSIMFDAVIVIASIALEIQYEGNSNAGLIILARLWRYIRLAHGAHEAHQHSKSHGKDHDTKLSLSPAVDSNPINSDAQEESSDETSVA